ncbi:MAG: disulfide bond formation protein B [Rhizobiaceae bacterium]
MTSLTANAGENQTRIALFLFAAMAGAVGTALLFQHVGGYMPCALCYMQRTPYYLGLPATMAAAYAHPLGAPSWVRRGLLLLAGLLMLYGGGLAIYHSGIEWAFWPGPASCTSSGAPIDTGGKGVLDAIDAVIPPSCDKAPWRFLGLSFAGWNVPISLGLAAIAFFGALTRKAD